MLEMRPEVVEATLEHDRIAVRKHEKLKKLLSNREFRAIVEEGYFKEEAARLVLMIGDPSAKHVRDEIQNALTGISYFNQYLRGIQQLGEVARNQIPENEELLDELRQIELEEADAEEGELA